MNTFTISSEHGSIIFQVMYQFAFLSGIVLFLYAGYKRNYPLSSLMLMLALGGFFLIAGTKLGTYNTEDWQQLFSTGQFPATSGKTILTGMLALMLGLLLAKSFLKMNASVLDLGALVVPVSMIFQKIGCLFAGCCYGLPTDLPWSVRYAEHYRIFGRHVAEGVAGCTESFAAPVHPVQLYEIVGYVLIIPILLHLRKRLNASGSLVLLSMAMFFGLRFVLEFLRDTATNHGWTQVWLGINIVQWFSLAMLLASSLWAYARERHVQNNSEAQQPHQAPSTIREVTLAILLSATLWLTYGWFTPLETVVFQCLALAALALMVVRVVRENSTPAYRWAMVSTAGLALLLMAQTVDIGVANPTSKEPTLKHQFNLFHLRGNMNLQYVESIRLPDSISYEHVNGHWEYDSCDDETYWVEPYDRKITHPVIKKNDVEVNDFKSYAAEWKVIKELNPGSENISTFGGYHYLYSFYRNGSAEGKVVNSTGAYFWFSADRPDFELKAGLQAGRLNYLGKLENTEIELAPENYNSVKEFISREARYKILPIFYTRLGQEDRNFIEVGIYDNAPSIVGLSRFRLGMGLGNNLFNTRQHFRISAGICDAYFNRLGYYVDSEIGIGKHIYLYPKAIFEKKPIAGLGVGIRFN